MVKLNSLFKIHFNIIFHVVHGWVSEMFSLLDFFLINCLYGPYFFIRATYLA
jgi:hypothetical protein